MFPSLRYTLLFALLFSHVTHARVEPFFRSSRQLTASKITSSTTPELDSSLICRVGCMKNCSETYLMRLAVKGEANSLEQQKLPFSVRSFNGGRVNYYTVSQDTKRVVCPDDSMVASISRETKGKFTLECRRLSAHLRKDPHKRGSQIVSYLSRINVREASDHARKLLIENVEREEMVAPQSMEEISMCGESYYVDGLECLVADCSTLKLLCVSVLVDEALAEELFCDLLTHSSESLLSRTGREENGTLLSPGIAGSPIGAISAIEIYPSTNVLAGVHVLGDAEWQSKWLNMHGSGSASCPEEMFVSDVVFTPDHSWAAALGYEYLYYEELSIRCSRIERDLRVGPQTTTCNPMISPRSASAFCESNGFVTGLTFREDPCPMGIQVECRSLRCP